MNEPTSVPGSGGLTPSNSASRTSADGLPAPRRYWSLAAIWLGMAMAVLDSVIANIALPTIGHDLRATPATAVWVINAYQVAIIMLLLPLAAVGEIVGYRRVYVVGLALFVLASIGCAFAGSLAALTAWRFGEGLGAAAIMAVNGALLRLSFPARQLGRGIGYNAVVVAISSAAGPTVAAAILAASSWRWLFAVNVPIGIIALAIGIAVLPDGDAKFRSFDWRSALLNAIAFGALFLTATDLTGGHAGIRTTVAFLAAVTAGIAVTRIAGRSSDPLIPVDLLRVPLLRISYATSICAFAGQMVGLVAMPFLLQSHFSNVAIGLLITGYPLGVALAAPQSGRLSDRVSPGLLGAIGLVIFALGFMLLAIVKTYGAPTIFACLALGGVGMGLFQSPNNRVMLSEAPQRRSGAAAGMMAVCRLVGQTLGALISAFGFRLVGTASFAPFAIAAGFALLGALLSASRTPSRTGSSSETKSF